MSTSHPALQELPLASRLKTLWANVDAGKLDWQAGQNQQEEWIREYAEIWSDAMRLPGEDDLKHSLCLELSKLVNCPDLAEVERRCKKAMLDMKADWEETVTDGDDASVVEYYDKSEHYAYELMWWHTLEEDHSPLAYVAALHLALQNGAKDSLDFGAGVASGSVLFSRHGISVTLADISSTLLDFSKRRLENRGIAAKYIDLKEQALPENSYDFITAMDVMEHIAEPEKTVEVLTKTLRPGGILFGRFASEIDPNRPSHIAKDFEPTFKLLKDLGFKEVWRDDWLWGHQAFQKPR
jgi:2-polyprenyl-3-methyl-5-hydroxy-6-metoxy-1,4-benzoquinol methylase